MEHRAHSPGPWPSGGWPAAAGGFWSVEGHVAPTLVPGGPGQPEREEGLWVPYPVEYKRGSPKPHQADELQLCAQALCLEEMLCCTIAEGALFYGGTRRRVTVPFLPALRTQVYSMAEEMHQLRRRGYTPKVKPSKGCSACSLKELCLPVLMRGKAVEAYLRQAIEEET